MNINLSAPINQLGYGIASLNILKAISNTGHKVALFPIGPIDASQDDLSENLCCAEHFDYKAASLRIWHQNDLGSHVGTGLRTCFPFFELTRFKPGEVHHLRYNDIIFTPSQWGKTILDSIVRSHQTVKVVPLGVDRKIFIDKPLPVTPTTTFINIGKWEIRKGHDVLIEAFNKAFGPADNVKLIMQCYCPFGGVADNAKWTNLYKNSPLGSKIIVSQYRLRSQREIANLIGEAHCGVFPARAESFNLELLECLSVGRQIITTDYAGHNEYANNENSFLIKVPQLEDAYDGKWFSPERGTVGQWGYFGPDQMEQLIHALRRIHVMHRHGELKLNKVGITTAKCFSWERTANAITNTLYELK